MSALLDVTGVSVNFGGLHALSDVSLTVTGGEIVGLIGPNGAGKTTLFNVISGLQRCRTGVIRFGEDDITGLAPNRRAARGIGRSFQNLGLIADETVLVNLMAAQHLAAGYPGSDVVFRPRHLLQRERNLRNRATEAAERLGVDAHLTSQVADLSFGVARLVELACVLAARPRLMLLDEPTTGLDAGETAALVSMLRDQVAAGITILLVAHDVRFVMDLCDRVYVLAQGRMLYDGKPADVQRHPHVIEAYLGRSA